MVNWSERGMNHTQNKQSIFFFIYIQGLSFQFALPKSLPLSSPLYRPLCFRPAEIAGRLLATHHSSHQPCHQHPQLSPHALTSRCSVLDPLFCISSPAWPHCCRTLPAFCLLSSPATYRRHFWVSTTFKHGCRSPGATPATTMSSQTLNCPDLSSLLCYSAKDCYCRTLAILHHQLCPRPLQ